MQSGPSIKEIRNDAKSVQTTQGTPQDKKGLARTCLSVLFSETTDEIHGQRKGRKMLGTVSDRAPLFRAPEVRDSHQRRTAGIKHPRRKQRTTSSLLHACHPPGRKPSQTIQVYKHLRPHHNAIYVVNMVGAQQFYQTLNGGLICFNTIPQEHIEEVDHIRDMAETYARIRGTFSVKKDVRDSTVEKDKE